MKPSTDLALVLLGLVAWLLAGLFGFAFPTTRISGPRGSEEVANVAAAGAACGFAIAGGLCLLGAALTSKEGRKKDP